MNAETVVEAVQTDAAETAAHTAAAAAAAVVTEEIAVVDERLAEHAEVSEERHEEILGDTQWLRTNIQSIQTTQASTNQLLAQVQTDLATVKARVDALPVTTLMSQPSLILEGQTTPAPEVKPVIPTTVEPEKVEAPTSPAESPAESPAAPAPARPRRRMV